MSEPPFKLSQGDHRVTYRTRRGDARLELKEAIDRRYVHVLFTGTGGGTELAFTLDEALSNPSAADWEKGEGTARCGARKHA